MKIVIVEDDALIAYQIEACVTRLGHEVLGSFDEAKNALAFVAEARVDFVFMDIEIKGVMDGIQCASMLKSNYGVPSLFVTSHDGAETIEEATSLNPLNFLPKPFSDKNIEAVVALASISLKKTTDVQASNDIVTFHEYSFNLEYNTLKLKDTVVKLTPKESKLIALLFKNIGNSVSNEEIQQSVWGEKSISSPAFRKLVSRANEALVSLEIVSDKGFGYYLQKAAPPS